MEAVLDLIINEIPSPRVNPDGHLQFQPSLFDYNEFVGRVGIGLVKTGTIKLNQNVSVVRLNGTIKPAKILKIFGYSGVNHVELEQATAGDIVGIAGISDINIGETICENGFVSALQPILISEPTIQITFGPNSSPFVGKAGKFVTYREIKARLEKELRDAALKVSPIANSDNFLVAGRGELHLGILIEKMRREGYELQVSKPKVIIKVVDGVEQEPFEELILDVPTANMGSIMDLISNRQGDLLSMDDGPVTKRLIYEISAAGLIGLHDQVMTLTKGYGIMSHSYRRHKPLTGFVIKGRNMGVLIATETGQSTTYALEGIEARGTMFITPGTPVYEGMIVGENKFPRDLVVNVVKAKALNNIRMSNKEAKVVLKAPRNMSLENCLSYLNDDELLEITPTSYRMRKVYLTEMDRRKNRVTND